jgi:hypothetical protein
MLSVSRLHHVYVNDSEWLKSDLVGSQEEKNTAEGAYGRSQLLSSGRWFYICLIGNGFST